MPLLAFWLCSAHATLAEQHQRRSVNECVCHRNTCSQTLFPVPHGGSPKKTSYLAQLSAAVDDPRGMQLGAPGSTELHYTPCAALVPFPVITHLLGSPFFREAAAGEELIATLSRSLEALAAAAPGHLGADGFKVRSGSRDTVLHMSPSRQRPL